MSALEQLLKSEEYWTLPEVDLRIIAEFRRLQMLKMRTSNDKVRDAMLELLDTMKQDLVSTGRVIKIAHKA